jgi:hypothetical protein
VRAWGRGVGVGEVGEGGGRGREGREGREGGEGGGGAGGGAHVALRACACVRVRARACRVPARAV